MKVHSSEGVPTVALGETNFELPGQLGEVRRGKVGDVYTVMGSDGVKRVAVVRTNRISAFDVVMEDQIPDKGQALNQIATHFLKQTKDIAPNWLQDSPDPNVSVGLFAEPIPVEMIVRGALLGSAAKAYEEGAREISGVKLPDNMYRLQLFDTPIVTPTTKAEAGQHDAPISASDIVSSGRASQDQYDFMHQASIELFWAGQKLAGERTLYLGDTKFEFGILPDGEVIVIDEILTPDSSRYYDLSEFVEAQVSMGSYIPAELSKEFVRDWLRAEGFEGNPGETAPRIPADKIDEISTLYRQLCERMTGRSFLSGENPNQGYRLKSMQWNIMRSLSNLEMKGKQGKV